MKNLKVVVLGLSMLIFAFFYVFYSQGNIVLFKDSNLDFFAKKILSICKSDSYPRGCYDREIPKILKKGFVTMEQAFKVTTKIQNIDKSYLYCHVLGHELSDIETQKNPSRWLDVIARCPPVACNNGCEHGAVMRRFKGSDVLSDSQLKVLIPDLKVACESRGNWKPSELEKSMCYHSLGHLAMYITAADVKKSIGICKDVAIKDDGRNYYQTCVQGVFMIIYQSLDNDDIALVAKIKPTKENLISFCGQFTGMEMMACRTEAWPYYYDDFSKPEGLSKFCNFADSTYNKYWCYDSGLRGQLSLKFLQEGGANSVSKYCMSLPNDIKEHCFVSIATGWVQDEPHYINDSLSLCTQASKFGYSNTCYNGLLFFSKFSFTKGSTLWNDYCKAFPEPFKTQCFAGNVPDNW